MCIRTIHCYEENELELDSDSHVIVLSNKDSQNIIWEININNSRTKMKTKLNILPFGQATVSIRSSKHGVRKNDKCVIYTEPQTTEKRISKVVFTRDRQPSLETTASPL
jgi:hypothetical protein